MKVLFISSRADIGGGPKHLLDLLSSTTYRKVEKFVALPFGYELSSQIISQTKKAIPIPHRRFSLIAFFTLLLFCRENGVQLIHTHGRGAGLYGRLLTLFGLKVVHTFHGIHHEKTLIGEIKLLMDRFLSSLTDYYICVSDDERQTAIHSKVCRQANVIPNGVHFPPANPYVTKDSFNVGLLARLSYQKGIDILIKHLKEEQNSPVTINIAGAGEEEEKLKEQAQGLNGLKFLGKTLDPNGFLKECDIFLSSSRWEGFPLSVLEAMAQGLPCLLPNVTGHGLFKERGAALFYDLHSAQDLREKLELLKNDSSARSKFSRAGYQLIKEELNIEIMAKKTISVYQEAI